MVAPYGLDGCLINELASLGGLVGACFELFPVDLDAGGFEDALDRCGYFGSDTFAGDQGDFVSHGCIVLYAKVSGLSKASPRRVAKKERGSMQLFAGFAILER